MASGDGGEEEGAFWGGGNRKRLFETQAPLLSHCVALDGVLPFPGLSLLIC